MRRVAAVLLAACLLPLPAVAEWPAALGTKLAGPMMSTLTDRSVGAYFGPLLNVTEFHGNDCGAALKVTSGQVPPSGVLVALRRVMPCDRPKPLLYLRLTIPGDGAGGVRAAMRAAHLGTPCLDGPGALQAPSLIWADAHRVVGVVQDPPPGKAFSVFFLNRNTDESADPGAERAVRSDFEADLPGACR